MESLDLSVGTSKEYFLRAMLLLLELNSLRNNLRLKSGTRVKAQIWDTAGQERYLAITTAHYRRAIGALVVYDICKRETFNNCEKWIQDVKSQADPEITIMLVGNKLDRANETGRAVTKAEAEEFSAKAKIMF